MLAGRITLMLYYVVYSVMIYVICIIDQFVQIKIYNYRYVIVMSQKRKNFRRRRKNSSEEENEETRLFIFTLNCFLL